MKTKPKKVKLWLVQSSNSGNANGHFELVELPVNSNIKSVKKAMWRVWKIFNVKCLGIFESQIGDNAFVSDDFIKKVKGYNIRY